MLISEGKASVIVEEAKLSKKVEGFYNPEMKLNRDISIWIVGKLGPKSILDANAASGIRSKRFLLETSTKNITASDINAKLLKMNLENTNIQLLEKDSNEVMDENNFDYIDIDPFGSPVPFLESAIKSINKEGVIALTSTDIGCLSGRFVKACIRKYDSRPMPCMFSNELGIRILIQKAIIESRKQNKILIPIFCHSGKHYYRVYLKNVEKAAANSGFVLLCRKCLSFRASDENIGLCCNKKMDYAGPLWLGSLYDNELIRDFDIIPAIKDEINSVGYYDMHYLAKKLKIKEIPKLGSSIDKLLKSGFKASKTHFCNNGIKTNATTMDFIRIVFGLP